MGDKVCLNEICEVYGREVATNFQRNFKHCPFCGALMTTFERGLNMIKDGWTFNNRSKEYILEKFKSAEKTGFSKHPESCECDECELNYQSEIAALTGNLQEKKQ